MFETKLLLPTPRYMRSELLQDAKIKRLSGLQDRMDGRCLRWRARCPYQYEEKRSRLERQYFADYS